MKAKLPFWASLGLVTLVGKPDFQAVIKSAASAASLGTQKIQKKAKKHVNKYMKNLLFELF